VAAGKAKFVYKHTKKGDKRTPEQKKKAIVTSRIALRAKKDITKTRFYPGDDTRVPLRSNKGKPGPTKLRKNITPGTVLIVLAGKFRGKRVVFLKQLQSGLLMITGPFKINGVPLRRVNQAYVIATSTKIDIKGVDVSKINDDFFKAEKAAAPAAGGKKEEKFLETKEKEKVHRSQAKKQEQKRVDDALKPIIAKVPDLKKYIGAKFSLTNGQQPHNMKF